MRSRRRMVCFAGPGCVSSMHRQAAQASEFFSPFGGCGKSSETLKLKQRPKRSRETTNLNLFKPGDWQLPSVYIAALAGIPQPESAEGKTNWVCAVRILKLNPLDGLRAQTQAIGSNGDCFSQLLLHTLPN